MRRVFLVLRALSAALPMLGLSSLAFAQAASSPVVIPATAPTTLPVKPTVAPVKPAISRGSVTASKPLWPDLTPEQQLALKPLVASWPTLSEPRKLKWLAMSKNFSQLSAAEQAKLQSRMSDWVNLSAQQRNQARINYGQAQSISPGEKQLKWQAYQALSDEERSRLASKAAKAPKGAAPALKPIAPQKITVVPTSPQSVKPGLKLAVAKQKIDSKTLLPRAQTAPLAASAATAPPAVTAESAAVAPVPAASN